MRSIAIIFILTCALRASAQVIDYEIDPSFDSGLLLNRGSVSDILTHENGSLLVTGMLNNWNSIAQNTSYFSASGSLIGVVGNADLHNLQFYLNQYINYGNSGIQRFNLAGQVPSTFTFEFSKPAYSGGLSNKALDALVMPDDKILVAGRFFTDSTLIGTSTASQGLRQLCMIDSTGAPVPGFPMLRCEWPTDSEINNIRQLSTGEYIITGSFDEVDGYPYPKLAKLNTDFSVNTDFEPVFGTSGSSVFITLIDSQDRIWVNFGANISVLGEPNYASRLVRLLPNGTVDENFNPPIFSGYISGTYENPVSPTETTGRVIEDEDGTFIVHGQFTEINGNHHRRLAKITDAGQVIEGAFQYTTPDSAHWPNWILSDAFGPVMMTIAGVVKKLPDGKLLIGGQFSSFGGEPYSCLVRLQPNGFVGLDEKEERGKLKIWPNPTTGIIRVALPDENERIERIEIADLQGRLVQVYSGYQISNGIDVSGLNVGIYLVRAWSETGVYTQKLILER